MKFGEIKKIIVLTLALFFFINSSHSIDNVEEAPVINLEDISATFEEEKDELENADEENLQLINNNINEDISPKINTSERLYVNLTALDRITAKTSLMKIAIGEKKYLGDLEIKPLKCALSEDDDNLDVVAYLQIKDLSIKNNDQVFVFNGWTFASSPGLQPIEHPVYDLWLVGCDNG